MFGLSVITILFEDDVEDFFARQQVNNAIATVSMPEGAEAEVEPPYGPTGEIFRYSLKGKTGIHGICLLTRIGFIRRQLLSVSGVADVVTFGDSKKFSK